MGEEKQFLEHVKAGNVGAVRRMLSERPGLATKRADTGATPLLLALYHGQREVAAALLEAAPDLDLFEAAASGDRAAVERRLRRDPGSISRFSADGFHALGLAAFFGHVEVVRVLLRAGAEVNAPSRNAMQVVALHSAAACRRPEAALAIARLLLAGGAEVNVRQEGGWTPLHQAASAGNLEMVRLFVARGAVCDAESTGGKTPADLAEEHGHQEVAEELRRCGRNGSVADG